MYILEISSIQDRGEKLIPGLQYKIALLRAFLFTKRIVNRAHKLNKLMTQLKYHRNHWHQLAKHGSDYQHLCDVVDFGKACNYYSLIHYRVVN